MHLFYNGTAVFCKTIILKVVETQIYRRSFEQFTGEYCWFNIQNTVF